MSYCDELPFGIISPNSYLNIETMKIIYSCDYYDNIEGDFVIFLMVLKFSFYYGYVDDDDNDDDDYDNDDISNCKKRIIEQWRV